MIVGSSIDGSAMCYAVRICGLESMTLSVFDMLCYFVWTSHHRERRVENRDLFGGGYRPARWMMSHEPDCASTGLSKYTVCCGSVDCCCMVFPLKKGEITDFLFYH